ncbi:flagellar hook-length control protein FliK [bacterium]|nr:flagellar hook-length control protein FliK [bacterium]
MKVSFHSSNLELPRNSIVRGNVVGVVEGKAMVVINGVPTLAENAPNLVEGQVFLGRIDKFEGNLAMLSLLQDGESEQMQGISADTWLALFDLPIDDQKKNFFELLRRLGFSLSKERFEKVFLLYRDLKPNLKASEAEAFKILLCRRLPKEVFSALKKYVEGKMHLGQILAKIPQNDLQKLRAEWVHGKLTEKLLSIFTSQSIEKIQLPPNYSINELSDNFLFQEILSVPPTANEEGRLYFQWPMFWSQQKFPDTLEGEAFFPSKTRADSGFSLRLLIHPPRIGELEIGIHKIQRNLWIHFGSENQLIHGSIASIGPALSERFQSLGWGNVKITVGEKSHRGFFLSPPENKTVSQPSRALDVHV